MPLVSARLGRKKVYPDWSVICEATPKKKTDLSVRLLGLIERISREHDLCLGFPHFSELGQGSHEERCQFRAAWLDTLDWVGVRPPMVVKELEFKRLYRTLFGSAEVGEPTSVFTGTFGLLFENEGRGLLTPRSDLNSILTLYNALRTPENITKLKNARRVSLITSQNLSRDRKDAFEKHRPALVLGTILQRNSARIADELHELAVRNASNVEWSPQIPLENGLLGIPTRETIRERLGDIEDHKAVIPYTYLGLMVDHGRGVRMSGQDPDSKGFQGHGSDMWDHLHLVGAAYCDVFSCDSATSGYLQNHREELGLARQLATGGQGWAGFSDALERAIFASKGSN